MMLRYSSLLSLCPYCFFLFLLFDMGNGGAIFSSVVVNLANGTIKVVTDFGFK